MQDLAYGSIRLHNEVRRARDNRFYSYAVAGVLFLSIAAIGYSMIRDQERIRGRQKNIAQKVDSLEISP